MIKCLSVRYFSILTTRTVLQRKIANAEIYKEPVIMVSFHRISKNLAKGHKYGLDMQ